MREFPVKETMKEHILGFHKAAAKHHMAMAEAETQKAEGLRALGEAGGDMADHYEKCAGGCDKAAESHSTMAEYHKGCCEKIAAALKADEDQLDKMVPTNARVTIPTDAPASARGHYKAVPRHGQPPLVNTAGVPAELQEFLKIEE
jgi:hypothetical protein